MFYRRHALGVVELQSDRPHQSFFVCYTCEFHCFTPIVLSYCCSLKWKIASHFLPLANPGWCTSNMFNFFCGLSFCVWCIMYVDVDRPNSLGCAAASFSRAVVTTGRACRQLFVAFYNPLAVSTWLAIFSQVACNAVVTSATLLCDGCMYCVVCTVYFDE